jgi:cytochrome c oxidase subunit 3
MQLVAFASPEPNEIIYYFSRVENSIGRLIIFTIDAMARSTPISHRPTGHNGSDLPPYSGGGDDGRSGRGGDSMPNYGQRLRRARMALAIFLVPVFMLFISFTVVYLIRRDFLSFDISGRSVRTWVPVHLPWKILIANTIVLILSTITADGARRAITREAALAPVKSIPGVSLGHERSIPWLSLTTILGVLFLAGQLIAWSKLSLSGFHLLGGTSSSFIYILTAMHGIHLAGGLLALTFANVAAMLDRPVESRRIVVDVTAWYWHFMTGLWICILALFGFAAH